MAIASRKLLGATGLYEMILLTAPIIITFILFFGDGTGAGAVLPALAWLGFLIIAFGMTRLLYQILGDKIKGDRLLWDSNSEKLDCGLFKIPSWIGALNIPYRLIFYGYTITYLIIHAFYGMDNISNGISILTVVGLMSVLDIFRLQKNNCYIGSKDGNKTLGYIKSGLGFGILFGLLGLIAKADPDDPTWSFFKS